MNTVISLEQPELLVGNKSKHETAERLFAQKRFAEAGRLLSEILATEETGELWNDWATAQFASGQITEAEHGFRRGLELEPGDRQTSENLGALLAGRRHLNEAIRLLKGSLSVGRDWEAPTSRARLLVAECQKQLSEWLIEFRATLAEPPVPVETIPHWPLDQMALQLAKQRDFDTAMKLLNFNLHFSPGHLGMVKMRECIKMLQFEERAANGISGKERAATPVV